VTEFQSEKLFLHTISLYYNGAYIMKVAVRIKIITTYVVANILLLCLQNYRNWGVKGAENLAKVMDSPMFKYLISLIFS